MQKKKFHYGWIILIASLLVFLINGGLTSTAFSVYLPHMIENGGYTNTQITLINTIRAVTALLTTLVTVTLINKLKPRMVVLIMCVSTAIAYFLFAFAQSLWVYYVAAFLVGSVNGFVSVNSLLIKGTSFDATQTAYFLSIFGTVMFVGKLVYGALHDSIGGLITNFIFTTAYVVGLFIIWLWIPSTGLMVAAIVMVALGCCLCASGLPCWAADLLPADQYDKAIGRNQAAYNLCALLFSIVPGPIADLTGSYRMVALILTVMAAIIFVIINRGYIINARLAKAAAAESN